MKILQPFGGLLGIVVTTMASAGLSQTVWTNAVDGVWADETKWSTGVPSFENAAFLTNITAAYTVTVNASPAAPFGNLTILNSIGQTTQVDVTDAELVSTNGAWLFDQGSAVVVKEGGVMRYTGTTPVVSTSQGYVDLRNGAVWRLEGGDVDFHQLLRGLPYSDTGEDRRTHRHDNLTGMRLNNGAHPETT